MSSAKQGTFSVTEYLNHLKGLCQEMDIYQNIQMKCSDDASLLKRFVENDRIYDFLIGLNMEFNHVQVQILGKEDFPSLNKTVALIRAKEGRRGVRIETPGTKSSALVTNNAR